MKNLKELIVEESSIEFIQGLEQQFDQMLNEQYLPDEPGATALVAINGKIVYHKAFGMASLELDVKMERDMVFKIGSITKQFTAVSILMLMEQGKLNLEDDITTFIEDYPTHGHHISIHHLLTHTSGIKSYSSMDSWRSETKDFEPNELIDYFKKEPMDFAPGENYSYNNSGYSILGYIIEKISGQTYGEFVETNIFNPLGMQSSHYISDSKIIKKRAAGYQKKENCVNVRYSSPTYPYAAGGLMSTVEDLFIWNRAICSNKLITQESIDLAFTNYQLNNGKNINYGYGWEINEISGSRSVEHNGGFLGFITNSIYLPNEDLFVAVYSNCDYNLPIILSTKMAAIAIGKPLPEPRESIALENEDLKKFVGVYDFSDGASRIVTLENNQLYSERMGFKGKITPTKNNIFLFENSFSTIQFQEHGNGVNALFTYRITKTTGWKTEKPIPVHAK